MRYFTAAVLSALLALNGAILAITSGQLPYRVASTFNGQGMATAFMPRTGYLLLMTALSIGLPLLLALIALLLVGVPRMIVSRLRIPSREYWIAPERVRDTLDAIGTSGLVVATLVGGFVIAVHLLVVEANARTPPRLDNVSLFGLLAFLLIAMLTLQLVLWRRFRVPR